MGPLRHRALQEVIAAASVSKLMAEPPVTAESKQSILIIDKKRRRHKL